MAAMANSPLPEHLGDVRTTDARTGCGGVPQGLAEVIHGVIPGSEVRLFGSRANGTAGPESDIDRQDQKRGIASA